ncbi:hypothetical protein BBR47_23480 [Brevibacillus brevis NBRC 100599]|uniref:Uncharacterized protein n=1 Tax=Brevibacillus brevis (strain 47 / JCM 6285 / NBRC 100599) TaxID=358681 RepID=C0ZC16_BREBN|nr:hypothetical protein BBR47_23480 [Brevibacillus brevis NBRC 100599]
MTNRFGMKEFFVEISVKSFNLSSLAGMEFALSNNFCREKDGMD